MPNSLWPYELQHTRLLCPSLSSRVCANSWPLSQWCHSTISSSDAPFSSYLNPSQHQSLFQWVDSSHQVAKVLELQLQHQLYQWIFRVYFLQDWLVWFPYCPRDSQECTSPPQFESINFLALSLLTSIHDYCDRVGNDNLLQYSCLKSSMNRGAWQARVHGVTKNWTWLSKHAHTHSSVKSSPWSISIFSKELSYPKAILTYNAGI